MQKKVVVVGLGTQGVRIHIPALRASSKVKLTGVISSDQKDVSICSRQFHVPGYTNFERCLDALKPDFVILAVYHNQYLPLVKAAAKRKVHILCEKPFGYDLAEAKKLAQIAASGKIRKLEGFGKESEKDILEALQYRPKKYQGM